MTIPLFEEYSSLDIRENFATLSEYRSTDDMVADLIIKEFYER